MVKKNRVIFTLLFLCSTHVTFAERIEFYDDWRPDAEGESVFERPESGTSFYYEIRKHLKNRGYSARNWDRRAHLPWLRRLKEVRSWQEFLHWARIGLSRKEVLEEETRYLILTGVGPYLRNLALNRIPKEKLILFAWEPPTVQPESWDPKVQAYFSKIYTWKDDLVDEVRFFKFYLPYLTKRIEALVPYEERKFLTLIAGRLSSQHQNELYSEREKIIRFFEERLDEGFDLYGRHWAKRKFASWRGEIPDKMEVLKQYRFAFAYENSVESGYITEKLWDCFAAGVVPVYWGAPNVCEYVPADCFIDRRQFASDEELLLFLKKMSKEEWEGYVDRAGQFLEGETAYLFTEENYAKSVAESISF